MARGIELGAGITRGDFRFDATVAYTDASVEGSGASVSLDGMRPAQTPKLAAAATVGWEPVDGALFALTLRHVGAQFEDDLETDILPAATTIGAFVQVPLTDKLTLVLRGENLTGETVITRNAGGSIDIGAPRTGWMGLRLGY